MFKTLTTVTGMKEAVYMSDVIGRMMIMMMMIVFFKNFYWGIVDLQCCVSFRCTAK